MYSSVHCHKGAKMVMKYMKYSTNMKLSCTTIHRGGRHVMDEGLPYGTYSARLSRRLRGLGQRSEPGNRNPNGRLSGWKWHCIVRLHMRGNPATDLMYIRAMILYFRTAAFVVTTLSSLLLLIR